MKRIYSLTAAICILMTLASGGGTYLLLASDAGSAKHQAALTAVRSLGNAIATQLDVLQASVDGIAHHPDVISALTSGNRESVKAIESRLQTLVPYSLRVRLLLPDINEIDQSQTPHMGFGDLDMVRTTLTERALPAVQGEGEHRHLAIASAVVDQQQVVGVVLASLKPDLPSQILNKIGFDVGLVRLQQEQVALASIGETTDETEEPIEINIRNSRWRILLWPTLGSGLSNWVAVVLAVSVPIMIIGIAFIAGYRKLTHNLLADQGSLLKAVKDLLQGKTIGNYPMEINEMRQIITAMIQFKRVLEQEPVSVAGSIDMEGDDFFSESFDIDFTEDSPLAIDSLNTKPTTSPISLPNNWPQDVDATIDIPVAGHSPEPIGSPATFHEKPASNDGAFEALGIRGRVVTVLSEALVESIGKALGSEAGTLKIKTLVVARDGRSSSRALAEALIRGVTATGLDVLDIGMVPAPVLHFVCHHTDGRSGVMVAAEDEHAEINGLQIVLNGERLDGSGALALKRRIDKGDYRLDSNGRVDQNNMFANEYIGIIADDIHLARPMTVVVDCGHGASAVLGPTLLRTMGCDLIELNCEVDGQFPNHLPDPSVPETFDTLSRTVKMNQADLGIAWDGDGDRLGLVDSAGRIIWPDQLLMLFARDILTGKPGAEILCDAACSRLLPEQIKKRGGRPLTSKNATATIHKLLRELGSPLAGTVDGRFFFNDRWFGFPDGLYAAARMIELLSADSRNSAEVFEELPRAITTPPLTIAMERADNLRFIEQLFAFADLADAEIDNTDGFKAQFSDGWALVRASGRSSDIEVRFEANSQDALARIQSQLAPLLKTVNPDISLPF